MKHGHKIHEFKSGLGYDSPTPAQSFFELCPQMTYLTVTDVSVYSLSHFSILKSSNRVLISEPPCSSPLNHRHALLRSGSLKCMTSHQSHIPLTTICYTGIRRNSNDCSQVLNLPFSHSSTRFRPTPSYGQMQSMCCLILLKRSYVY